MKFLVHYLVEEFADDEFGQVNSIAVEAPDENAAGLMVAKHFNARIVWIFQQYRMITRKGINDDKPK